jgi:hypothetical protein
VHLDQRVRLPPRSADDRVLPGCCAACVPQTALLPSVSSWYCYCLGRAAGWLLRCPLMTSKVQCMGWTCRLCGSSGRRNLEDALPSWVLRYAEMQPGGPYVGTAYGRPYSGRRPPASRVPVCASCNGWMGRTFEEPAKRLLIPMFKGYPLTLLPDGQRVIARWTAKSALMQVLFDLPEDHVPTDVYRTFRATGEPPVGCQVFIGRYADNGRLPSTPSLSPPIGEPPTRRQAPPGARLEAITFNPVLGHFVGQFFLPLTASRFESAAAQLGLVIPIWPLPGHPVTWPPERSFTVENAFLRDVLRLLP